MTVYIHQCSALNAIGNMHSACIRKKQNNYYRRRRVYSMHVFRIVNLFDVKAEK